MSMASARLATSTIQKPPTTSRLSAKGPSLEKTLPSRTRTRAPWDAGESGAPRRSFFWSASSRANSFICANPFGSSGSPSRSVNKSRNSTMSPPRTTVDRQRAGSTVAPAGGGRSRPPSLVCEEETPALRRLLRLAARLVEEPDAALRLVDPDLDQAGRRHVAVLLGDAVRLAQARREPLVVLAQLGEHVRRSHVVGVVVLHALQTADLADRSQRGAAELAHALRHRIRRGVDLVGV